MFRKSSARESTFFFNMKEGCKVSCVTLIAWLIVFKEVTNTLFFYISDYGVEYSAECCAEYGPK